MHFIRFIFAVEDDQYRYLSCGEDVAERLILGSNSAWQTRYYADIVHISNHILPSKIDKAVHTQQPYPGLTWLQEWRHSIQIMLQFLLSIPPFFKERSKEQFKDHLRSEQGFCPFQQNSWQFHSVKVLSSKCTLLNWYSPCATHKQEKFENPLKFRNATIQKSLKPLFKALFLFLNLGCFMSLLSQQTGS